MTENLFLHDCSSGLAKRKCQLDVASMMMDFKCHTAQGVWIKATTAKTIGTGQNIRILP
jgi:hypothetical protein